MGGLVAHAVMDVQNGVAGQAAAARRPQQGGAQRKPGRAPAAAMAGVGQGQSRQSAEPMRRRGVTRAPARPSLSH
jgi:hypothetical protein